MHANPLQTVKKIKNDNIKPKTTMTSKAES